MCGVISRCAGFFRLVQRANCTCVGKISHGVKGLIGVRLNLGGNLVYVESVRCIMSANSYIDSRLISFTTSGSTSVSATSASATATTNTPYDLLTFLGIAQSLNIDFLPITWDAGEASIGQGGTAEISQSSVNLETAFAFKRLSPVDPALSEARLDEIFKALIAELCVLGHKSIRGHRNINKLEGICWDIEPEGERVWPAFVFEKTQHGDLKTFMEHGVGTRLDLRNRLRLCAEIATAV